MAVTCRIDPEQRLICVWYTGFVTMSDSMDAFGMCRADPRWSADFDVFVDISDITDTDIGFNQMLGMAHRKEGKIGSPHARMAFWAPGDMGFAIARMYASLTERADGLATSVFRDKQEALAFLGRDKQALPRKTGAAR